LMKERRKKKNEKKKELHAQQEVKWIGHPLSIYERPFI
jgi:hypothetical protein